MRWPWARSSKRGCVVLSWDQGVLAYIHVHGVAGAWEVAGQGVLRKGTDDNETFSRRVQALALAAGEIRFMLRPDQYQLLQIEAPQVPDEEVPAAARWKIRELVDAHLDDLTLDVCRVGDPVDNHAGQLFVVAARNELVREMTQLGQRLQGQVQVIDVWDMAQRNLQTVAARKDMGRVMAQAAVVVIDPEHCLLTISAKGELYYSRRIDLPRDFLQTALQAANAGSAASNPAEAPALAAPEYYSPDADPTQAYSGMEYVPGGSSDGAQQRLVVEIQRSLDVWDRTWSSLPLEGLKVFAGARSGDMAQWLSRELGLEVSVLDVSHRFPGFKLDSDTDEDLLLCWPLLGLLLRDDAGAG